MNLIRRLWLFGLVLVSQVGAQESSPKSTVPPAIGAAEYQARRDRLIERFKGAVVLMEADPLIPGEAGIDANTPRFDFTYLAGYHREGDILALGPGAGDAVLFSSNPKGAREHSGVEDVRPLDGFVAFVRKAAKDSKALHTRLRKRAKKTVEDVTNGLEIEVKSAGEEINRAITRLRLVKSPAELDHLRHASDSTNKAQIAAMKACRPGLNESQLQKLIEETFWAQGCDGQGFPPIVAAGRNGTILHYMKNRDLIPATTTIVIDIGASLRGYTTDITRTLPTSGKFPPEHLKAYQCVLDAQKAAEAILKPGVTLAQLHEAAAKVFEERELTDWSFAHSEERGVRHGLGHFVGLSVHDSGSWRTPLEPGMIITIEPGYYNRESHFGIRIEDIYIVTEDGFERMSAGAPREPEEIEKLMKSKSF